jgi:hypothetical protein
LLFFLGSPLSFWTPPRVRFVCFGSLLAVLWRSLLVALRLALFFWRHIVFDAFLFFIFGSIFVGSTALGLVFGLWPLYYISALSALVIGSLIIHHKEI